MVDVVTPEAVTEDADNGHIYQLYSEYYSYNKAKAFCENLGGHLATITSSREQNIIGNLVKNKADNGYYLGGVRENNQWKWITGETFAYTNWAAGQPDNYNGTEDKCTMWSAASQWNDNNKQAACGFVLEIEPETLSVTVRKGEYQIGDTFNSEDIVAELVRGDGSKFKASQYTTSNFNTTTSGTMTYRVSSQGLSANVTVKVKEPAPAKEEDPVTKEDGPLYNTDTSETNPSVNEEDTRTTESPATTEAATTEEPTQEILDSEEEVQVEELEDCQPKKTNFTKITMNGTTVTLKWKNRKNVEGYEIKLSKNKSFSKGVKKIKIKNASISKCTIKKLATNQRYYVKIRTYDENDDGDRIYSDWSKKKKMMTE